MSGQLLAHRGMFVGGVIVEDRVDGFSGGDLALDRIKKANELLVAMARHVAPDHGSVEDVHRRKQGRRPMPVVIMGLVPARPLFMGRPG
jgi:hypothetical protein